MTWEDDAEANIITVRESYLVDSLCTVESTGLLSCTFLPQEVSGWVGVPDRKLRQSPYGLAYPKNAIQEIEVFLPRELKAPTDEGSIEHAGFRFTWDERFHGRRLSLKYTYEALADHVALEDFPQYLEDLGKVWNNLGATLYPDAGGTPSFGALNWLLIIFTLVCLGGSAWLCRRILWRPFPPAAFPQLLEPRPLGGWLFLLAFGILAQPVVVLFKAKDLIPIFDLTRWNALTMPGGSEYAPIWMPLLLFEVAAQSLMLVGTVALWPLFFGRSRLFPRAFVAAMSAAIVLGLIDQGLYFLLPDSARDPAEDFKDMGQFVRGLFVSLLWMAYLAKSSRAKETFVFPLEAAFAEPGLAGAWPEKSAAGTDPAPVP